MLACSAYPRRRFPLFACQSNTTTATCLPSTRQLRQHLLRPSPNCSHSTLQSIRKGHHRNELVKLLGRNNIPPPNQRRRKAVTTPQERDALARLNNAHHLDTPDYEKELARKAAYEAQFLGDPLELANAVLSKLRGEKFVEALELVRASEKVAERKEGKRGDDTTQLTIPARKVVENVVSWNHLMDWLMEQNDTGTAMKVYNEMKKRGHRPDAHTYTIMLRGFGRNVSKPNSVKHAVNVYNSIYAPNSAVKPNTIHTNAVINTCARGGDMDSLWAVAGRLPEKGFGSPDCWTYTSILNAIQHDAKNRAASLLSKEGADADVSLIFDEAVNDGRKLWRDIVIRWQKGDVAIDEQLVCAMGRLLLLSNKRKDVGDVYLLVAQTMNIKPKNVDLGSVQPDAAVSELDGSAEGAALIPIETEMEMEISDSATKDMYAVPGTNTLSMVIEAATLARETHIGKFYWDVLTSDKYPFQIAPDAQNIMAYLRLLRISRASRIVLEVLRRDWPPEVAANLYTRGTFVVAMSTCVRDKNNPNVFDTAGRILDLMQQKSHLTEEAMAETQVRNNTRSGQCLDMDPKVLTMYLNLAMVPTKSVDTSPKSGSNTGSSGDLGGDPRWHNVIRALKRLGPDMVNVSRMAKLKMAEVQDTPFKPDKQLAASRRKRGFVHVNQVAESLDHLAGLLKAMISANDRILAADCRLEGSKMVPFDKELISDCMLQKKKLSALLAKVDQSVVKRTGRSGLWEGYDRDGVNTKPSEVAKEDGEARDDEVFDRDPMVQTVAMTKLTKEAWVQRKRLETIQENRKLSRRQAQEKEKDRRAERQRKMYLPRPPRDGPTLSRNTESWRGKTVQPGWGGGYDQMAEEMGQRDRAGLMELGR